MGRSGGEGAAVWSRKVVFAVVKTRIFTRAAVHTELPMNRTECDAEEVDESVGNQTKNEYTQESK